VKLLNEIQRVQVPPGKRRAGRPVASVAIHRATGGCEAYTARVQAMKNQLRNRFPLRCRRSCPGGRQNSGRPLLRGRAGVAGVASSGHAPTGISQEPRRALHLLLTIGGTDSPRETGGDRDRWYEQSYEPICTCEGGEPQGSRKGRPRNPLEGRGEQTDVSVEGNISETQNSRNYVHETRQTI
jgi:hypothetical protein